MPLGSIPAVKCWYSWQENGREYSVISLLKFLNFVLNTVIGSATEKLEHEEICCEQAPSYD